MIASVTDGAVILAALAGMAVGIVITAVKKVFAERNRLAFEQQDRDRLESQQKNRLELQQKTPAKNDEATMQCLAALARLAELPAILTKQHRESQNGLDSLIDAVEANGRSQEKWLQSLLGNGQVGYQDMTEAEAVKRERAETLVRRYGLSHEEAMERVSHSDPYGTENAAMREAV